jgi:lipooligosaccharide transport system permease protein
VTIESEQLERRRAAPRRDGPLGGQGAHASADRGGLSFWRAPSITRLWWPVFRRNMLVWRKLFWPSLLGNTAEPLISLVAFGYGLGALVGSVAVQGNAVPYVLFLASGYICTSAMNASSFEALYSGYSRMEVQKTWAGIMNAPVTLDDVVTAEIIWATFKSMFTVAAILLVMLALGLSRSPTLLLALPVFALVGLTFSCMAYIFTALAKGYDFFTYYFTLFLTPMVFTSGVFFPRDQLPPWLQAITDWLPLTSAVELVRPLFLGHLPAHPFKHLALLVVIALLSYWVALALIRRRFAK